MILTLFILLGIVATIVFVAGYTKGVKTALFNHANPALAEQNDHSKETEKPVGLAIFLAVLASIAVIALAGVHHVFLYLGPLLVIVTALGNGYAFFYESGQRRSAR